MRVCDNCGANGAYHEFLSRDLCPECAIKIKDRITEKNL